MPLNILIINQNEDLCGTISRFLCSEGHQAVCCSSEQARLQKAFERRPDLIIVEVAMPELAAIEVVNQIHRSATTRHIPLIIISDFPELELELLHIFDFITTPVDLRRLREDIDLLASGARKRAAAIKFPAMTNHEHEKFHDFLILHSGLHFERRNIRVLERGLESRMTALRIGSFSDYYEYLGANMVRRQELQKLLQLLTIGETFFFRYNAHFEAFRHTVLPQLLSVSRQKSIRIWSAGCSTGEEPYSIAMAIMESIPHWKKLDIKIIATDINSRALSRAREGVYNAWKVRVTEQSYIEKYFKKIGESYVVRDEVKSLVEFSYLNLQSPPQSAGETFDAVFCRNVMIYFTTATTRKVVESFAAALKQGGYLFLGHSETLAHISTRFERHIHDGAFYYRKKTEVVVKPAPEPQRTVSAKAVRLSDQKVKPLPVATAPVHEFDPEVEFAKGESLLQQENFLGAAEIFENLLRQRPEHTGALLGLAQIHLVSGRMVRALEFCNQALVCDDLLPAGFYLRGLLYEMLEQESVSLEEYRKAILLQMDFIMPHYQLGKLSFRRGDHKSGLRELNNSLKLLEKCARESIIPYSGGLSREVFIGHLRNEIRAGEVISGEFA